LPYLLALEFDDTACSRRDLYLETDISVISSNASNDRYYYAYYTYGFTRAFRSLCDLLLLYKRSVAMNHAAARISGPNTKHGWGMETCWRKRCSGTSNPVLLKRK
jgi:hypothetical protein